MEGGLLDDKEAYDEQFLLQEEKSTKEDLENHQLEKNFAHLIIPEFDGMHDRATNKAIESGFMEKVE